MFRERGILIKDKMPIFLGIPIKFSTANFAELGLIIAQKKHSNITWDMVTCAIDSGWALDSSPLVSRGTEKRVIHEFMCVCVRNLVTAHLANPTAPPPQFQFHETLQPERSTREQNLNRKRRIALLWLVSMLLLIRPRATCKKHYYMSQRWPCR